MPLSLFNSLLVTKILMILVIGENSHSFITRTLQERSNPKKTTTLSDMPSLPPTNSKLHSGEISKNVYVYDIHILSIQI